ncbi:uncharacterized protein LOC116204044 [Punica granatum]|uniref:Uncharacterized protein LOC116204044 n=1 Tax=Punica granatum TaxID=22663 RepID=A0A6P8DBP3_PUNGR|nr:uncharacterized protein LOC116204044 [Punica granatum]
MPFDLKNAEATYQRAMIALFHDMMHKEIEVYVNDMIAKSNEGEGHLVNLKRLFDRLRKYKLRLNPAKCTFGVKSGKILGFVVSEKGIEVDPDKVKAIMELLPPSTRRSTFLAQNNIAEYEACIFGLQAAIDLKVKELEVFDDSMLTIFQTLKQWKTKDPKLVPYHEYHEELIENFENISFIYTTRMKNQFADALATLASIMSITNENLIEPLEFEIAKGPAHCDMIEAVDCKPWYGDIKHLLQTGQFPAFTDRHDRRTL